ncbi:hypothetical protein [Thermopetrobacter sp. TC1]|uniref:hypothetical protein n=1 Tax=Thermopetrobacter sp. TC1 TaxID=1495045 RepID=UPI0012E079B7|nr:hypothetical protein [Thermopetrobacter sp. TC1]
MIERGDIDLKTHQNSRFGVLIFRAFSQHIISDVGYDEWNGQFYQAFDDGAHLQWGHYERKYCKKHEEDHDGNDDGNDFVRHAPGSFRVIETQALSSIKKIVHVFIEFMRTACNQQSNTAWRFYH